VAFDTQHRGTADRRLVYAKDGSARMEIDSAGTGQFVDLNEAQAQATRQIPPARDNVH
jgi:hypothetical protein